MNFLLGSGKRGEPTVAAGHDVFLANDIGESYQALGDKLGVLDQWRGVGDDAGDEGFTFGHLHIFPHLPFMLVARIAGLKEIGPSINLEHDIDDIR